VGVAVQEDLEASLFRVALKLAFGEQACSVSRRCSGCALYGLLEIVDATLRAVVCF
jgi:hypothetical protein